MQKRKRLNLCIPNWQASGCDKRLHDGALDLRSRLPERIDFADIPIASNAISEASDVDAEKGILGYAEIDVQLRLVKEKLAQERPSHLFTLAGTCGSEVIPVSYLNSIYEGELTVLWFDAHGDLNTPQSSPSHHFHGMPLRTLLGEGEPGISELMFSTLSPAQVTLMGVRDLDQAEQDYISDNDILSVSVGKLENLNELDRIIDKMKSNVYVHFDFDVLDPSGFPHLFIPVEQGLRLEQGLKALQRIVEKRRLCGFSLVELCPQDDSVFSLVTPLFELLDASLNLQ